MNKAGAAGSNKNLTPMLMMGALRATSTEPASIIYFKVMTDLFRNPIFKIYEAGLKVAFY